MARPNPNPDPKEARSDDEQPRRSREVQAVVDRFFGDDPDDDRPGGGR